MAGLTERGMNVRKRQATRNLALLCLFISIAIFIVYVNHTSNIHSKVKKYEDYTIGYGETYFNIACDISTKTGVYEPIVQYDITSVNKIPADMLQPGQIVKIPVY